MCLCTGAKRNKMKNETKIKLFTIPNCVTLCNLLCGSAAAVMALVHHNLEAAFWLVVAAAVCDFLDGFTARLLKSYSGIGVELDSLADMVSFGFAPAAILYTLYGQAAPHWNWPAEVVTAGGYALFLLAGFSALRLAKFNVDDTQHEEFCGLPTPACALFFASSGWLVENGNLEPGCEALLATALLFSWLLISPIRMFSFKFKHFGWNGNELRYLFLVASIGLLVWSLKSVPVIILLYVLISALRWVACRRKEA